MWHGNPIIFLNHIPPIAWLVGVVAYMPTCDFNNKGELPTNESFQILQLEQTQSHFLPWNEFNSCDHNNYKNLKFISWFNFHH